MIGSDYCKKSTLKETRHKIVVEGNIASGKSTLLRELSKLDDVQILDEPVNEWRNTGGENLIGRMYQDPQRWSYLFQCKVFLSMFDLHHKKTTSPVCVLERSVYSARYCFVNNLHQSGAMDNAEYACYCDMFDRMTEASPPLVDLIVYLRTSPEICYQRLMKRSRKEEKPVTLNYLESLHDRYETWLGKKKHHSWHKNAPVIVINGDLDCTVDNSVHAQYRSTIFNELGFSLSR